MKLPLQTVLAFVILHVAVAPSPPKMMMMGGGMGPMMMSLSAMGKMSNMGKMSSMGMMTMGKMSDSMSEFRCRSRSLLLLALYLAIFFVSLSPSHANKLTLRLFLR